MVSPLNTSLIEGVTTTLVTGNGTAGAPTTITGTIISGLPFNPDAVTVISQFPTALKVTKPLLETAAILVLSDAYV